MVTLDPQLNYLPEDVKSIHIMGICGTGMAALAGMLKASGYIITGSDANVYPPMSVYLEKQNIELFS
ncbi:MAG: UDP-N-acetylmuramate:L-alanyl-gamma-D-glutamyl-meso-diaminopimelate ligase, partial [Deltaproteobacteria bacterium]